MRFYSLFFILISAIYPSSSQIDSLESLLQNEGEDQLSIYIELANQSRHESPIKGLEYGELAEVLAKEQGDDEALSFAKYYKATCQYNLGYFHACINSYQGALDLFNDRQDSLYMGNCHLNMGASNWNIINYVQAIYHNQEASKIFELTGDVEGVALCYNNLGNIYSDEKKHNDALNCYKKSIALFKSIGMVQGLDIPYANIGVIYDEVSNMDSSLHYKSMAIAIKEEFKPYDKQGLGLAFNNTGAAYLRMGMVDLAEELELKALNLQLEIEDNRGLTYSYAHLGEIATVKKEYKKAEEFFRKSLEKSQITKGLYERKLAYVGLQTLLHEKGEYKRASALVDTLMGLQSKLYEESSGDKIAQYQVSYETFKKEQENEILIKESKLKELASEKDKAQSRLYFWLLAIGGAFMVLLSIVLYSRYRNKVESNKILEHKNEELDKLNTLVQSTNEEIVSSIHYSKRIQNAILPTIEDLKKSFSDVMLLYKPKDIVSGDFYWLHEDDNHLVWVVADCTGHGVPGALMSMIGNEILNEAVISKGLKSPSKVLKYINEAIIVKLKQDSDFETAKDGMDMGICILDKVTNKLCYGGANMSLIVAMDHGRIEEVKSNKRPIGFFYGLNEEFQEVCFVNQEHLWVVMSSDGYRDQFGGDKNKKFKKTKFMELFNHLPKKDGEKFSKEIDGVFESWKGEAEQVDDVCILGVRLARPNFITESSNTFN